MESKREDLLLSARKSESHMNGQYVAGAEQSLLFGWNDRMSGIRLSSVFSPDGTLISAFTAPHCGVPSRASIAAGSAAQLPLMPTWPGTKAKTISCPSWIKSESSS